MGSPTLALPSNTMFRRTRSRGGSEPVSALKTIDNNTTKRRKSRTLHAPKESPFRSFFRLASHSSNNKPSRRKNRRQQRPPFEGSSMGLRRSTSTHFTRSTTNRSSAFLFDPEKEILTMADFLLAEELAALEKAKEELDEESKEEIVDIGECNVHAQHDEERPLHRIPAPESYFEMTKNENDELGCIQFEFQSLEEAQEAAARRQIPILCIEAEIPGDVTSGQTIFSHPLLVEAAESLFVTVRPQPLEPQNDLDETNYRRRFFCNSSCRTRVRILDHKGVDVLSPVEHMSIAEVVSALVRGLESYRMHIPQYLKLLFQEETGKLQVLSKTRFRTTEGEAVFGVFDSVMAEVEFAGLEGILSTRSGALVRQPVVRVTYDSQRVTYGELARHALRRTGATAIYYETNDERIAAQLEVQHFQDYRKVQQRYAVDVTEGCLPAIKVLASFGNIRADRFPKPALKKSILRFVPLTDLQATRANRLIHYQKFDEAMHLLSPRQGLIAMQALRAHHSKDFRDVVDVPICAAWNQLSFEGEMEVFPLIEKLHYVTGEDDETESLTDDEDALIAFQ